MSLGARRADAWRSSLGRCPGRGRSPQLSAPPPPTPSPQLSRSHWPRFPAASFTWFGVHCPARDDVWASRPAPGWPLPSRLLLPSCSAALHVGLLPQVDGNCNGQKLEMTQMGPHRGLVKEPLSDLAQVTARGTGLRVAEREADARKPVWLVPRVELCCASVCV